MAAPPRCHVDRPLQGGDILELPSGAARHVQVLRLQPGDRLRLFDGRGHPGQPGGLDWSAEILQMGRSSVQVRIDSAEPVNRELPRPVSLALGMPANERMDWLVEKAGELGATVIEPLVCARSVLRMQGERAEKRLAHWQGIAVAASEQCGRARVCELQAVRSFRDWLRSPAETDPAAARYMLSFRPEALGLPAALAALAPGQGLRLLSGPEGGLSPEEEAEALAAGWRPLSLGPRVLRAETAPLMVLAAVAAQG